MAQEVLGYPVTESWWKTTITSGLGKRHKLEGEPGWLSGDKALCSQQQLPVHKQKLLY
jgi:hypothetical protein